MGFVEANQNKPYGDKCNKLDDLYCGFYLLYGKHTSCIILL